MVEKYFDGHLPGNLEKDALDDELIEMATSLRDKYEVHMEKFQFSNALAEVWRVIARANKYIDETTPWALSRDEAKVDRLACVLYNLCEVLRVVAILISPFMPNTSPLIGEKIGAEVSVTTWESAKTWGKLSTNASVKKGEALFPRMDVQKELEELSECIK